MTAEIADIIIVLDTEYRLHTTPLKQYWEKTGEECYFSSLTTGFYRGYYATWTLLKDKLYLIDLYGRNLEGTIEYGIEDLFPDSNNLIFASWYTGELMIPYGKQLEFMHAGWGASHEFYTTVKIQDGIIIDPGIFQLT